MTRTRWIIFAFVCLGILAFAFASNKNDEKKTAFTGDPAKVITEGPIADHAAGNSDGKVVLVEYGDFQCPACKAMYPAVAALKEEYKNELTFVFRDFPLTSIHSNALAAATAAEAAGLQDKFYQMHDELYYNQDNWKSASGNDRTKLFEKYAKAAGVSDMAKFRKDLESTDVSNKIHRDQDTAKTYNVNSTPSFILNGEKLPSETATDATKLRKAVEDELSKAGLQKKE